MPPINMKRILLGGVIAGLFINIGEVGQAIVIADGFAADLLQCGITLDAKGGTIIMWVLVGMSIGITNAWLYATFRPRFGPGPKTAILAGLMVWFLAYFLWCLAMVNMEIFSVKVMVIMGAWGLVEMPAAALIAAWFYREPEPAAG